MHNLRIFVVVLLLIPALPESAWCQDTGARQPGAVFQQRKADAVNQLNERVSSLQQRLSCVQAANDGNALRACMQQIDAGGNGGEGAGGAQGGGQFPQFKAQALQRVQDRLTAVQQRLACVQAAKAPEALQACPSANPGQVGGDNSRAVASGGDNGGPPASGGNVAAPTVADKSLDTVAARITGHGFPSIFEAWAPVANLREPNGSAVPLSSKESPLASEARHDLYWGGDGRSWD